MRFFRRLIDRFVERSAARARRWALRRQGHDATRLTLDSRRIYILPTAPGLIFALMSLTILAGAMNYNNNIAFALGFLLVALAIVSIYHTHRTLAGLRVNYLGAEPVFAGEALDVRFSLVNDSQIDRDEIFLDWERRAPVAAGVSPLDSRQVGLPLPTQRRGALPLPGLRISTRAPLGLMRAWAWIHLESKPLVWPRPSTAAPANPQPVEGHAGTRHRGEEDFAGLRAWQPGDSPRRIAWKHYARTEKLLVRDLRGGSPEARIWIDWDALPASDVETRIARLTRMVLDAHAEDRSFGLRIPGRRFEPAQGQEQLRRCLDALATVAPPAGSSP